jgi:hypothetical protein
MLNGSVVSAQWRIHGEHPDVECSRENVEVAMETTAFLLVTIVTRNIQVN